MVVCPTVKLFGEKLFADDLMGTLINPWHEAHDIS